MAATGTDAVVKIARPVSVGQDGVDDTDPLVAFLYYLMRDEVPTGRVAAILREVESIGVDDREVPMDFSPSVKSVGEVFTVRASYTNLELAQMATRYARRLRRSTGEEALAHDDPGPIALA